MEEAPDELLADFQETYGMDVWFVSQGGIPGDVERIAALAWQLPKTSRTWRTAEPLLENETDAYLLRQIELNQRLWAWAHTKDAENGTNEPAPLTLPGEREWGEEKEKQAEKDAMAVAAAFNL